MFSASRTNARYKTNQLTQISDLTHSQPIYSGNINNP